MSDIIKHIEVMDGVYMYIDKVSGDDVYHFTGWLCSTKFKIEDILIEEKTISPTRTERPDVDLIYGGKGSSGISFSIAKEKAFNPLQIKFKDFSELYEIESWQNGLHIIQDSKTKIRD